MYCLKCSHVNIWDLGSSAWTVMRRVLTEQVLYLSYVMQINMHGQHMFWVYVDFCWLLKWTISLISKSLPSCSSRAHHHRPEQFRVYKHTDSFVNIDETYLLKHTYHVCILQKQMCVWNQFAWLILRTTWAKSLPQKYTACLDIPKVQMYLYLHT